MEPLDRALSDLKSRIGDGAMLAPESVSRIASACFDDLKEPIEAFRPTFRPRAWLSALAVTPAAAILLAFLAFGPDTDRRAAAFVGASKVGGHVIFDVADGRGPHIVTKSTNPARFNPSAATTIHDGRFADRANSGPVIVYYRID